MKLKILAVVLLGTLGVGAAVEATGGPPRVPGATTDHQATVGTAADVNTGATVRVGGLGRGAEASPVANGVPNLTATDVTVHP